MVSCREFSQNFATAKSSNKKVLVFHTIRCYPGKAWDFFSPQEPLVKYSIPECKDTCELDEFVKLVKSLQVRDITSWCHACGNTQLSRCQVTQQQTVCPTLETKEPRLSGTGGFFLGSFVTLLIVICVTALWHFYLRKRCLLGGTYPRPRKGLSDLENTSSPGVI